jgi:hypothetical protein
LEELIRESEKVRGIERQLQASKEKETDRKSIEWKSRWQSVINLKEADQRKSQLHHFTIGFQKPGICADSRFLESSKLMRMTGSV